MKARVAHFGTENLNFHEVAQLSVLFRYLCKIGSAAGLVGVVVYSSMSSANNAKLMRGSGREKSAIIMLNSMGLSTHPCGTPCSWFVCLRGNLRFLRLLFY